MLTDLHIKNFALIDEAHIRFKPGLNVMTGETGAGKTIILEAMNLLLGKRADPVLIGGDGDEALVEAAINSDGEELVLARFITGDGKNKCHLNGRLATLTMLTEKTERIVDFHGQHEHQALLKTATHLAYLDAFGLEPLLDSKRRYEDVYGRLKATELELDGLTTVERDRRGRVELTRFQIDEIERALLKPGQDKDLEKELLIMRSAEKLAHGLNDAFNSLQGSDEIAGAAAALDSAGKDLEKLAGVDDSLQPAAGRLRELAIEVNDLAREIGSKRAELIFDQARLEEAVSRLEMIKNLKKKYGMTVEEVLEFGTKAKRELEHIEKGDAKIAELKGHRGELEAEAQKLAEDLTSLRVKTSVALEKTVESELADLSLKGCRFKTSFADTLDLNATGRDQVAFLISPNVGTGLKPLAKVASGGEVSRIMLALKIAFIKADPVPVLIFDEIDSGIGGEIAANVGQKLKRLAASHQVICITHLPQIASFGDEHLFVDKKIKGGVSVTTVKVLDETGRVEELSRMLTGGEATAETSRRHAKELLGAARKKGRDETK